MLHWLLAVSVAAIVAVSAAVVVAVVAAAVAAGGGSCEMDVRKAGAVLCPTCTQPLCVPR